MRQERNYECVYRLSRLTGTDVTDVLVSRALKAAATEETRPAVGRRIDGLPEVVEADLRRRSRRGIHDNSVIPDDDPILVDKSFVPPVRMYAYISSPLQFNGRF